MSYFSKKLLTGLCSIGCAFQLMAQAKTLPGKVVNKTTNDAVRAVTIRNVNTGKTLAGKGDGSFAIEVNKGQILAFTANGFYTDTLTVSDSVLSLSGLRIGLKPLPSTLQNVTVTAGRTAYQNDSLARREDFLALVGNKEIPAVSRANDLGFGIGINLDRYGKTEKRKRNARDLFDLLEEDAYVNYRWNEAVVEKYTRFKGEQLYNFMQMYRPAYAWLRKHLSEEDLLYYINDKLKKFKQ